MKMQTSGTGVFLLAKATVDRNAVVSMCWTLMKTLSTRWNNSSLAFALVGMVHNLILDVFLSCVDLGLH